MQRAFTQYLPKWKANAQLRWKKTWPENNLWDPLANVVLAMDVPFPETEEHFMLVLFPSSPITSAGSCSKDLDLEIQLEGDGLAGRGLVRSKRQLILLLCAHCPSQLCISTRVSITHQNIAGTGISAPGKPFSCVIVLTESQHRMG